MISKEALEKNRKILAKHGHGNLSDEEIFEISKNISALGDVILNFEEKRRQMKRQNKPKATKTSPNKSK